MVADNGTWDAFDMVAVQDWTGYASRLGPLRAELTRVGLIDRTKWFWQTASPFCVRLGNNLKYDVSGPRFGGFDCTMGHYRILKTALGTGVEHLLVLEDDACFCSDVKFIASALRKLPVGWDFIKMDWWFWTRRGNDNLRNTFRDAKRVGGVWAAFNKTNLPGEGVHLVGTGAVGYSRAGMQWKVDLLERAVAECVFDANPRYTNIDGYDTPELASAINAYCAVPCLVVQRPHGSDDPHIHAGRKGYLPWQLVGGSTSSYGGYS